MNNFIRIQEEHPLRNLDISYCDIGPIGGEHIAKGIQVIHHNDIDSPSVLYAFNNDIVLTYNNNR